MAPVALLAALLAASAPTGETERLCLCGEPGAAEDAAAVALSRWMRSTRIEVQECGNQAPPRRLVLASTAGRVLVQLHTPTRTSEREVPWLEDTHAPLSRLRQRGLLARFSVLVEGLLVEDRLGTSNVAPSGTSGTSNLAPSAGASNLAPSGASNLAPDPGTSNLAPSAGTSNLAPSAGTSNLAPSAGTSNVAPSPGTSNVAPSAATSNLAPDPGTSNLAPDPTPETPENPWIWGVEALGSFRIRSPYFSCWEVGGAVRWGPLSVGASYQPEARWDLSGRSLNIDVIGFWLGGKLGLLSKGRLEGGVLGAVRVDWVDLYRQDTRVHFSAADAGASLGAFGALRLGPVNLALQLEGVLMPTARLIEIPGASARRFNLFGLRLGLAVTWDFAGGRSARLNESQTNPIR